jgi:hypothetical protein
VSSLTCFSKSGIPASFNSRTVVAAGWILRSLVSSSCQLDCSSSISFNPFDDSLASWLLTYLLSAVPREGGSTHISLELLGIGGWDMSITTMALVRFSIDFEQVAPKCLVDIRIRELPASSAQCIQGATAATYLCRTSSSSSASSIASSMVVLSDSCRASAINFSNPGDQLSLLRYRRTSSLRPNSSFLAFKFCLAILSEVWIWECCRLAAADDVSASVVSRSRRLLSFSLRRLRTCHSAYPSASVIFSSIVSGSASLPTNSLKR